MNEEGTLTLKELNAIVRFGIKKVLPDAYWIVAEINEARVASNGHCFLELVEKDNDVIPVAKARGTIWASTFSRLRQKFVEEAGHDICPGIKVRVKATAEFHELYGYSLNIIDIDAAYTLGELYLKRKEIIRRLEEAGVINMNKELGLPLVIQRIAIISSPTAAGYGDFCNQLKENPYGISFSVELFPASMQGEHVEEDVIKALDKIYERVTDFDAVVLARGGGATLDLSAFDSFEIAYHLAQFPLPVISGIGHERDHTVVDEVACVSVKTPTAAAQHIITHNHDFMTRLGTLAQKIKSLIQASVTMQQMRLRECSSSLGKLASGVMAQHREHLVIAQASLDKAIRARLHRSSVQLHTMSGRLTSIAAIKNNQCQAALDKMFFKMTLSVNHNMTEHRNRLHLIDNVIANNEPQKLLDRGFSIIRKDGKAVRSKSMLTDNDICEIEMADGKTSIIINKLTQP